MPQGAGGQLAPHTGLCDILGTSVTAPGLGRQGRRREGWELGRDEGRGRWGRGPLSRRMPSIVPTPMWVGRPGGDNWLSSPLVIVWASQGQRACWEAFASCRDLPARPGAELTLARPEGQSLSAREGLKSTPWTRVAVLSWLEIACKWGARLPSSPSAWGSGLGKLLGQRGWGKGKVGTEMRLEVD